MYWSLIFFVLVKFYYLGAIQKHLNYLFPFKASMAAAPVSPEVATIILIFFDHVLNDIDKNYLLVA